MKELTKKSRIRIFIIADILISLVVGSALFVGAFRFTDYLQDGYKRYNKKPDDELSRSVQEAVGEDFYYRGKDEDFFGEVWYEYLIKKKDKVAIAKLVNALNVAVEGEQRIIGVQVCTDAYMQGVLEPLFLVENFSDDGLKAPDYDGMYAIYIYEPDHASDERFCDPSIYTEIEGIRKLCIDSEMQEKAEKQRIDWYEIWPDLEEMLVGYDDDIRDDEFVCWRKR